MSGIPDIGIFSCASRLQPTCAIDSMGGALRMLRDALHHERSNRARMHVRALGCPQHEAADAHAAEAHFGTLRAISSSSCKPHLNLALIRAILNGWSSKLVAGDRPDNGDRIRNPQRARALSPGEDAAGAGIMLQSSLRSAAILSSPRGWRQLQRQRSRRVRRRVHIPHLGRGRPLRHIRRLLSVQPLRHERPRHTSPRRASCRKHRKQLLREVHIRAASGATGAPRCATAARASFRWRRAESRGSEGTKSSVTPAQERRQLEGRSGPGLAQPTLRDHPGRQPREGAQPPAASARVAPESQPGPGVATAQHQQGGGGSHLAQRGLCQQTRQRRAQCACAGRSTFQGRLFEPALAAALRARSSSAGWARCSGLMPTMTRRLHLLSLCLRYVLALRLRRLLRGHIRPYGLGYGGTYASVGPRGGL